MPNTREGVAKALDDVKQMLRDVHDDCSGLFILLMLDSPKLTKTMACSVSPASIGFAKVRLRLFSNEEFVSFQHDSVRCRTPFEFRITSMNGYLPDSRIVILEGPSPVLV